MKAIVSTLPEFDFFRDDSKTTPRLETGGRRRGRRKHPTKTSIKQNKARGKRKEERRSVKNKGEQERKKKREEKNREKREQEKRRKTKERRETSRRENTLTNARVGRLCPRLLPAISHLLPHTFFPTHLCLQLPLGFVEKHAQPLGIPGVY